MRPFFPVLEQTKEYVLDEIHSIRAFRLARALGTERAVAYARPNRIHDRHRRAFQRAAFRDMACARTWSFPPAQPVAAPGRPWGGGPEVPSEMTWLGVPCIMGQTRASPSWTNRASAHHPSRCSQNSPPDRSRCLLKSSLFSASISSPSIGWRCWPSPAGRFPSSGMTASTGVWRAGLPPRVGAVLLPSSWIARSRLARPGNLWPLAAEPASADRSLVTRRRRIAEEGRADGFALDYEVEFLAVFKSGSAIL